MKRLFSYEKRRFFIQKNKNDEIDLISSRCQPFFALDRPFFTDVFERMASNNSEILGALDG
ncbi:hypothetical protein CHCC14821_3711 [Bacillus paralicheniformis]|nr:hypothetical protein CHCC14821_3711 [Bacillus paralicheniformis]